MDWRDVAEAMLEGARMVPEERNHFYKLNRYGNVIGACALGAIDVGLAKSTKRSEIAQARITTYGLVGQLSRRYIERFGSIIGFDNDRYGRDYVLSNVKELLNESSADVD